MASPKATNATRVLGTGSPATLGLIDAHVLLIPHWILSIYALFERTANFSPYLLCFYKPFPEFCMLYSRALCPLTLAHRILESETQDQTHSDSRFITLSLL